MLSIYLGGHTLDPHGKVLVLCPRIPLKYQVYACAHNQGWLKLGLYSQDRSQQELS